MDSCNKPREARTPGVLFHHETLMKDFFYDLIEPWVHYVPIKQDLSDLKDMFEWAKSHDEAAKAISKRASEFVRKMMSAEGLRGASADFVESMGAYIQKYSVADEDVNLSAGTPPYTRHHFSST